MEITKEDKIALLEFLGYKPSETGQAYFPKGEKRSIVNHINLERFNPLKRLITLFQAMDIIEESNVKTVISYRPDRPKEKSYVVNIGNDDVFWKEEEIREEVLLNVIIGYIKSI